MTLHAFVIAAMLTLSTTAHVELAQAIASAVSSGAPLFKGDADRHKTAALVIAVAFRESSFRMVPGDFDKLGKPHSFCAMQIHDSSGGTAALLTDYDACVRKGLTMLRTSVRVCPAHPVAWYAEGPRGCTSARAQRISRDRMWLAKTTAAKAIKPAADRY